jgi:TusA-related sulfurtransferase
MLCAQALAQIAKAIDAIEVGKRIAVRLNAEDVRRDTVSWVTARGHTLEDKGAEVIWIERKR